MRDGPTQVTALPALRAARDLDNVEVAEKGPTSYGKRVVRRKVYRSTNGVLSKALRKLGL